jgi:ecotin
MTRILIALFAAAALLRADNMKAFPPADEGMTRHVIHLPAADDEDSLKVELIVGKKVVVDPVNRHFFGGTIEQETIEGWGFTRYLVKQIGPLGGTLMAPPPGAANVERFVTIGGGPFLIRYNSRLPVVVYVPQDAEVRYRIWRADENTAPAPKG